MLQHLVRVALTLGISLCCPWPIKAADLFQFQGPYTRASGGAGLLESQGAAASLHNPANLSKLPSHTYFDLGLTHLKYQFAARGRRTDSGTLKTTVPLLSFGGGLRIGEAWTLGIALVPLGLKGQEIKTADFPVKIGRSLIVSDVSTQQASYKIAVGLGYDISPSLKLGIGAVYHENDNRTIVYGSNPDNPLFVIKERSQHIVPILGLAGQWKNISWAAAYTHPRSVPYSISLKEWGNEQQNATGETYQAGSFGFGLAYQMHPHFNPYGQYVFERWAPGQDRATSGILKVTEGDKGTDYRNTHNLVLGNKFRLAGRKTLYLSAASFDANKAAGVKDDNGDILYEGVKLRDFEGLARIQATAGMSYRLWERKTTSYLSYMQAAADAPVGSPSEGTYKLHVYMLGSAIVF